MSNQEPVAQKPVETRTRIELPEPWAGQYAVVKTVLSARLAATLDKAQDDLVGAVSTFETLVIEHNLLDLDGKPATSLLDADIRAVGHLLNEWKEKVSGLPS